MDGGREGGREGELRGIWKGAGGCRPLSESPCPLLSETAGQLSLASRTAILGLLFRVTLF